MTAHLKTLGIALVAAIALCLLLASVASAVEFHSESEHTTLEGEQTEPTAFVFEAGTVICEETVYKGTQESKTATEVILEPEYLGCTSGGAPVTINTNGCVYRLYEGEKVAEGYDFLTDIVCPEGQVIDIHTTDVKETLKCTITIPGQVKRKKVTYTNKGIGVNRDVLAHIHYTGTQYYQHKGTAAGSCKTGAFEKGTKKSTKTTRGYFETFQVGFWVE
jgi:hypothetical protein